MVYEFYFLFAFHFFYGTDHRFYGKPGGICEFFPGYINDCFFVFLYSRTFFVGAQKSNDPLARVLVYDGFQFYRFIVCLLGNFLQKFKLIFRIIFQEFPE